MKKLPIGIQNICEILSGNFVYVDKTDLALKLIKNGKYYFMSRPRRFGKSLFISTLEEIFKGNKELFQACEIYHSSYDWSPYPVLHFDFSQIPNTTSAILEMGLKEALEEMAGLYDVPISGTSLQAQLRRLIKAIAKKQKSPLVILIDEYDKPIINHLNNVDIAMQNRTLLRDFFGTLKGLDADIKFTFITGVSKFSQVSLFSGLNNLKDITMVDTYSTMLGYTEDELKHYFTDHIQQIASKCSKSACEIIDEVRTWYNGYRFSKEPDSVYNPFSTLNYMESGDAESYWYSTGTPSFLIEQIKSHPGSAISLGNTTALKSDLMDINDIDHIDLTALMFQTGYLTIQDYNTSGLYSLGFPNEEVRQAFFISLVRSFTDIVPVSSSQYLSLLESHDLQKFFQKIQSVFASFPYPLFTNAHEITFQGMLLAILKGMGCEVHAEYLTNLGRIDLILETSNTTYIIECKLNKCATEALSQIKDKKYFERSTHHSKDIALIGINFSSTSRNISEWEGLLLSANGDFLQDLSPSEKLSV